MSTSITTAGITGGQTIAWPLLPVTPDQAFRSALANIGVPKIYSNSFINFLGASDVAVMLGHHGQVAGIVTLSWPAARALATKLTEAVSQYEQRTGTKVGDFEELTKSMSSEEKSPP